MCSAWFGAAEDPPPDWSRTSILDTSWKDLRTPIWINSDRHMMETATAEAIVKPSHFMNCRKFGRYASTSPRMVESRSW